jgi:hypothetical protein
MARLFETSIRLCVVGANILWCQNRRGRDGIAIAPSARVLSYVLGLFSINLTLSMKTQLSRNLVQIVRLIANAFNQVPSCDIF